MVHLNPLGPWARGDGCKEARNDALAVLQLPRAMLQLSKRRFRMHLSTYVADTDDGGNYKVTAKNKLGESNANINLNLEG